MPPPSNMPSWRPQGQFNFHISNRFTIIQRVPKRKSQFLREVTPSHWVTVTRRSSIMLWFHLHGSKRPRRLFLVQEMIRQNNSFFFIIIWVYVRLHVSTIQVVIIRSLIEIIGLQKAAHTYGIPLVFTSWLVSDIRDKKDKRAWYIQLV